MFQTLKVRHFFTNVEKEAIIERINLVKPDLVFVALGCPKQEFWMREHRGKIRSCMLGLGQAFYTYAGMAKRSPRWMQNLSLEWSYRLYLEPRRLWKRYLVTNLLSIFICIKQLARSLKK